MKKSDVADKSGVLRGGGLQLKESTLVALFVGIGILGLLLGFGEMSGWWELTPWQVLEG